MCVADAFAVEDVVFVVFVDVAALLVDVAALVVTAVVFCTAAAVVKVDCAEVEPATATADELPEQVPNPDWQPSPQ